MRKTQIPATAIFFLFIYFIFNLEVQAQSPSPSDKPFSDLFNINAPLELNLIFDVKTFIKNKANDDYMDARISYYIADSTLVENTVRIRARGNLRRKKCYLPPIKIDFNDENYQVDLFNTLGKAKLVSLCRLASNFEQYLIKEYLCYKVYETITDISFKTYFLKINFIDSEGKKKPFTSYSFILEDIDDVAKRNNAVEVENQGLILAHLDRPTMNTFAMYQYLIGNVDWYVPNLHNIKLIKSFDHKKPLPLPVPYDLDYAGIVNANYAVPHERIPIESITERYWMGHCLEEFEYKEVQQTFLDNKDEILQIFESCDFLDKYSKNSSLKYINAFYTLIEKENYNSKALFEKCY
jgi:hypothetical protein